MKLEVIPAHEAAMCASTGIGGALIFLFAFPKGAISTLMHAVLHLPGPGAGIAMILGPFLLLIVLIPSLLSRGKGGAVIASLTFAATYSLVAALFDIPVNPKGAFGSALFVAGVTLFGLVTELAQMLGSRLKGLWRCMLSGALANAALLIFYWVVVFPRTDRWILRADVPILVGLCLVCGLAFGCISWGLSRPIGRALGCTVKE
jgi:hypothetical protein